jgi:hypothetical protein
VQRRRSTLASVWLSQHNVTKFFSIPKSLNCKKMLPDIFARSNEGFLDFVFFGQVLWKIEDGGNSSLTTNDVVCPVLSKHAWGQNVRSTEMTNC